MWRKRKTGWNCPTRSAKCRFCSIFDFILQFLQNFITQNKRLHHHSWNMERPFVEISFRRLRHGAVAMQIAVPFGKIRVGEMLVGPVADESVLFEVLFVARRPIRIQRHDDGLALRPPEFHVLRIVLRLINLTK